MPPGHQWVRTLAWFNFKLEYQKGYDNAVADLLSQVITQLDPDMVRSILDRIALGAVHWAKVHDPCHIWGWPLLRARGTCCCMPCTHANACYWLGQSPERGSNVRHSSRLAEGREEDRFEGTSSTTHLQQRRLTDPVESAEFHNSSGSHISLLNTQRQNWGPLLFVVPNAHHVTALNRCHRDASHQGWDQTLSLLRECFWWPGMINRCNNL